jgi:hypothetical protein
VIDLINVNPLVPPASGGPAPGYKWNDVETLLNVIIMANQLGPNANNISAAARWILYELNQALEPQPLPPNVVNPMRGTL